MGTAEHNGSGPAPGPGPPAPVGHRLVTSDPERAAAVLQDSYRVSGGVRISGDREDFRFAQQVVDCGTFAVTRFQCTMRVGYQGPLEGWLCVEQINDGRLAVESRTGDLRTTTGDVCLIPPHEAWRATTDDVDLAPLVLDRAGVEAHAAAVSGIEPGALAFSHPEPVSPAAAAHWNATVAYVRDHVLSNPVALAAPLVQDEAFRLLSTGILTTFPNNAAAALERPPGPAGLFAAPAAVRRAIAFIDANAHRPIGLADIVEAARLGPRGLQNAFRRHRGCTPMGYLRQVRMRGAHRDLQAADPARGDLVAVIAARWGFAHPGRFAVEYRRIHGCSPGETLRR